MDLLKWSLGISCAPVTGRTFIASLVPTLNVRKSFKTQNKIIDVMYKSLSVHSSVSLKMSFSVHKYPDTYLYVFMSMMRFKFFIYFKLLHSFSLVFTSLSLCVSVTTTNNSFLPLKIKWIIKPFILTNCIDYEYMHVVTYIQESQRCLQEEIKHGIRYPNRFLAIISDDYLQNYNAGELRSWHHRKPTVKKCDRPWVSDDAFMGTSRGNMWRCSG